MLFGTTACRLQLKISVKPSTVQDHWRHIHAFRGAQVWLLLTLQREVRVFMTKPPMTLWISHLTSLGGYYVPFPISCLSYFSCNQLSINSAREVLVTKFQPALTFVWGKWYLSSSKFSSFCLLLFAQLCVHMLIVMVQAKGWIRSDKFMTLQTLERPNSQLAPNSLSHSSFPAFWCHSFVNYIFVANWIWGRNHTTFFYLAPEQLHFKACFLMSNCSYQIAHLTPLTARLWESKQMTP
jgi:hypothetical protein